MTRSVLTSVAGFVAGRRAGGGAARTSGVFGASRTVASLVVALDGAADTAGVGSRAGAGTAFGTACADGVAESVVGTASIEASACTPSAFGDGSDAAGVGGASFDAVPGFDAAGAASAGTLSDSTSASTTDSFAALKAGSSLSAIFPSCLSRSVPASSWSILAGTSISWPFCTATRQSSIAWASRTARSTPMMRAAPLSECAARMSGSITETSAGSSSRRSRPSSSVAPCDSASALNSSKSEKPPRSLMAGSFAGRRSACRLQARRCDPLRRRSRPRAGRPDAPKDGPARRGS